MKKRNIIIIILCAVMCCAALLKVFRGYSTWSEETFNKLMYENQEAYAGSQKAEVIAKVKDVNTFLKTITTVLEACTSEEEIQRLAPAVSSLSEEKEIGAEEVAYYSFSDLKEDTMGAEEKAILMKLKRGESVISNVYRPEEDKKTYYGAAEPVCLDGVYVGFVRGLIDSQTLLYSSQTGFLRDETESYLIHINGDNAFMDYTDEEHDTNMYDSLEKLCDEPGKIRELRRKMENGEDTAVIQTTVKQKPFFISCSRLPYNDWIILSSTASDTIDKYIDEIEQGGRSTIIAAVCVIISITILFLLIFYWGNKDQRFEQKRASLIANFSDTVLCEYDMKRDTINCTSNIEKMLLIPGASVDNFRVYIKENSFVHPDDRALMKKILYDVPKENEVKEYELRFKNRDGEYNWYAVHITALYIKGKMQNRYIIKITDITESKREMMGLVQKSQKDILTKLLNKEAFKEKVSCRLKQGKGGYLFMMDLDNFKQINDRYGHQTGDDILQMAAESMKKCFCSEDYVSRYGGDEFLAFMPECSKEAVKDRAEALVNLIGRIRTGEEPGVALSCSVGAARYLGGEYEELLERADKAMYRAKESGRNSWIIE